MHAITRAREKKVARSSARRTFITALCGSASLRKYILGDVQSIGWGWWGSEFDKANVECTHSRREDKKNRITRKLYICTSGKFSPQGLEGILEKNGRRLMYDNVFPRKGWTRETEFKK